MPIFVRVFCAGYDESCSVQNDHQNVLDWLSRVLRLNRGRPHHGVLRAACFDNSPALAKRPSTTLKNMPGGRCLDAFAVLNKVKCILFTPIVYCRTFSSWTGTFAAYYQTESFGM